MIGKYPPIEGGVSMHQYWCAHSLAALGHQIHVITNAKDVEPNFRMLMRHEDWLRCEGDYPGGGSVRVHWSDTPDHRQRHIPWHNPFVTKLASLAAQVIQEHHLQVVFSYYLEPYGIAGHLAARMTARPHVVKHAGSDVGHLRLHPQFRPLYDHIFRTADRVITGGTFVQELNAAGVLDQRLFLRDDFRVPESIFCPKGDALDLSQVFREIAEDPSLAPMSQAIALPPPYLGIYGKLGEAKGTFDLLRAVKLLRDRGKSVSLIVVGHSFAQTEAKFHELLAEFQLNDSIVQLPFLPNWRIADFIRLCQAVCFLERDFPIKFHTPTVPREVLACGKCLIGSAEVLQRQFFSEQLIHEFNCLAVRDVRNSEELASLIHTAMELPEKAEQIGKRGHQYSAETELLRSFPRNYEVLFSEVIEEHSASAPRSPSTDGATDEFLWTRQVVDSLPEGKREDVRQFATQHETGPAWALAVYVRLLQLVEKGELDRGVLVEAVRLEVRLSGILNGETGSQDEIQSSLFRFHAEGNVSLERDLSSLYAQVVPGLKIEGYDYDLGELLDARQRGELPLWASQKPSQAAIVPGSESGRTRVISISPAMHYLLSLCDGTRTVAQLETEVLTTVPSLAGIHDTFHDAVINCFRLNLVRLSDRPRLSIANQTLERGTAQ
jgi:glycosyltransferase involved in cell wall biosynthesis